MLAQSFVLAALFASSPVLAGKRGLAWPYYNSPLDPALLKSDPVVAIYDWETYQPPSSNGNGGLEFIGMQRATDADSSPIGELASRAAAQGWSTVFTLNEPDTGMISAADAASWYITYVNPLNIKKALPAITSSTSSGQGLSWLANFISACGGSCYYDYINLHWYGGSFSDFQSYIEGAHAIYPDTPFVISEFALANPAGGAADQCVSYFPTSPSYTAKRRNTWSK
ncbi:hypothetical protein BDZ89DRAFT_1064926 [Hymenopellis radicata]|nr:hypothetical protein BDZ89DRAFT_1064926 [Hymenopellis radicata]